MSSLDVAAHRKAIRDHHERLKESEDYEVKLDALERAAEATVQYLSEIYRQKGLCDYRRIEKMAGKALDLTGENLRVAQSYYDRGQVWRATIGLNSIGLDFYIIQSAAERILALSGKHADELADSLPRRRLPHRLLMKLKKVLGHDRRSPYFSFAEVEKGVRSNLSRNAAEERREDGQEATGVNGKETQEKTQ